MSNLKGLSVMVEASSMTPPGVRSQPRLAGEPWLAIVGIGEDGLAGLSPVARALIAQAELVAGGERHLALADAAIRGKRLAWPSPLTDAIPLLLQWRGQPVCVLATGDPFLYGIGATLTRFVLAEEMIAVPAPSAFSLLAAQLGWALQHCTMLSLHGRHFERLLPHLQPGAKLLLLSWDGSTPGRVAEVLVERGFAGSHMVIGESLGGPRAHLARFVAGEIGTRVFDNLNTIAVDVVAGRGARVLPRAPGLPDDWFEHDGQITKREIRALTISALAPRRGELLWDIGAGSGSVGIEWMLSDPANRALAIEARPDRAARAARNALALGVPDLEVVHGEAPGALIGLVRPDAIFIGGGAGDPGLLDAAWQALRPEGRLVVNAVTLETQALLIGWQKRLGGALTCVQIARADPIGDYRGWRAAMPVVQWTVEKPS
jgi:precorrin-6Y C5,15-methyltransferase (decarboxylating)